MKVLIFLLLILLLAVIWDFYKGKIPNILILTGVLTGTIFLVYQYGMKEILSHIPGILFPIILLFPLYKIGTLGAGDLKLFSILGFYFTFFETLFCMFTAFWVGAIISLFVLLWRKNLQERIWYFLNFLKECFSGGQFQYYYLNSNEEKDVKSKIHFSLPIFISVIFYLCMMKK